MRAWLLEFHHMGNIKSQVEYKLIAALTTDAFCVIGAGPQSRALRLTLQKIESRLRSEGICFLTKQLPLLCKALDRALCLGYVDCNSFVGFKLMRDSKLPMLFGEFFERIFDHSGVLKSQPDVASVKLLRQLTCLFYKYELPNKPALAEKVILSFQKNEDDLRQVDQQLEHIAQALSTKQPTDRIRKDTVVDVARGARICLNQAFSGFDPQDIIPSHGPGAVATRQKLWKKYDWTNVSDRITAVYPFDAYFLASVGHACDSYRTFNRVDNQELPARVILVPKDSRGPRLISCEPVDFQWIQQGLGRAIVRHIETNNVTRDNVRFTCQDANRNAALLGSRDGRYATLDLKDASDRISLALVRLLFPEHIYMYLEACRTRATTLPDGRILPLCKFAPMGSSLCFPVLALTVWALLSSVADTYTRERIYVYGDDVIVPTTYVERAISILELFGLVINRNKSCTTGLFRESCGMDAFKGVDVTPVRIRTVWSAEPSPEVYSSWIAYANSMYDRRCFATYDYIVSLLIPIYRNIPWDGLGLASVPSLREQPETSVIPTRVNEALQKLEYFVPCVVSRPIHKELDGWTMLLRYFTEFGKATYQQQWDRAPERAASYDAEQSVSVRLYTARKRSMLRYLWR